MSLMIKGGRVLDPATDTDKIADIINRERLFVCKDGHPVSSAFVFRTVKMFPDTFVLTQGRVFLMI